MLLTSELLVHLEYLGELCGFELGEAPAERQKRARHLIHLLVASATRAEAVTLIDIRGGSVVMYQAEWAEPLGVRLDLGYVEVIVLDEASSAE